MAQKRWNLSENSGISLIELMIVIGVFSLLMAMAAPAFDNLRQRQKASATLRNIATLLLNSRFVALKTNSPVVIEFSAGSYRAFLDNGNGSHKKDWVRQPEEQIIGDFAVESGLTLTNNCNPTTYPDKFRYTGKLRVSPCTITLAAEGEEKGKVVINAVGRVRIEKSW